MFPLQNLARKELKLTRQMTMSEVIVNYVILLVCDLIFSDM